MNDAANGEGGEDGIQGSAGRPDAAAELLRFALAATHVYTWEADLANGRVTYSQNVAEVLGFTPPATIHEAIGRLHPDDRGRASAPLHEGSTEKPTPFVSEYRMLSPQDGQVWLRVHGIVTRRGEGAGKAMGIAQNITREKQDQEALKDQEERLRMTYSALGIGAWEWDRQSNEVYWSREYRDLYGLPADDAPSFAVGMSVVVAEDQEAVTDALRKATAGDGRYLSEHRVNHASRGLRWIRASGQTFFDAQGLPLRMVGIATDITDVRVDEQRRKDAEQQLIAFANAIPQLAWIAEADGQIFWYNDRWYEYTGTTLEEMRGSGWQGVHDPAVLPNVLALWQSSLASGTRFEMEFPLRGADGAFRWFLTRVEPLRDARGTIIKWVGTNTDIHAERTRRESLADEANLLKLIDRTAKELSLSLNEEAVVQAVTDTATKLTGARFGAFFYNSKGEDGEVYQLYTLSGAPREAFEKFGHPRPTALFGPTFRGDAPIRIADVTRDPRYGKASPHFGMPPGHLPVRSYLAAPVISRSGKVLGGLFFGHPDVGVFDERAERFASGIASHAAIALDNAALLKAAEAATAQREHLLESERMARSEAERLNHLKDEFLATLSHELRTPLSAILGWAAILKSKKQDLPSLEKGLETIERNARIQTQMIEDLLDVSRVISGKLRLDMSVLMPFRPVAAAVESLKPSALAKGLTLDVVLDEEAGPVRGDSGRLQQVVWNLMSNAIKFTESGTVRVVLDRVESTVRIRVCDQGAGIPPDFMPSLFTRFSQVDSSTTRATGGLGIGLSIVKSLVDLHEGTIFAESGGEGRGACFTVTLPIAEGLPGALDAEDRPVPSQAWPRSMPDLTGKTILVVDDQDDTREVMLRLLREAGANVASAESADRALQIMKSMRIDLLVSDIGMPKVDGYDFIQQVRADPDQAIAAVPAIALTAFASLRERDRALAAGFTRHVAKPVDAVRIFTAIAELLRDSFDTRVRR